MMAKIGYARVSSKEQHLDRQLDQLTDITKLFIDKQSGKNKQRQGLQDMLEYIREGDRVVVTELDRLGRNNQELTEIMSQIKAKNATLEVLNLPSLQGVEEDNLRQLINNLILEIYKYQAESERKRIKQRQKEGIRLAKQRGVYKGRPEEYSPTGKNPQKRQIYFKIVELLEQQLPIAQIARETGVSRPTVYTIQKKIAEEKAR